MSGGGVVPRMPLLTEEQFTSAWLGALSRLCRRHGDSAVALMLGVSSRHLRTLKAGSSLPGIEKVWNLLAYDDSAHDELDAEFGHRNVPTGAAGPADPVATKMAILLARAIEAERPESHGGVDVTLHEILAMASTGADEAVLRDVARTLQDWVCRLDAARRPVSLAGGER